MLPIGIWRQVMPTHEPVITLEPICLGMEGDNKITNQYRVNSLREGVLMRYYLN